MRLKKITCENCGGSLKVNSLSHIKNQEVICQYCGATYLLNAKYSKLGAKLEVELEQMRDSDRKEATKAEWEFKNKQEDRKHELATLKYFGLAFAVLIVFSLSFSVFGDGTKNESIQIATSEKDLKNENYKIVTKKLEDMGFKNIKTEKVKDLKIGILNSEGEVKEVTINGENDFKKDDEFDKNSKIKIYYHVFNK